MARKNKIRNMRFYDTIDGKLVFNRSRFAKEQWKNARFDAEGNRVGKDYKGRKYKKDEQGNLILTRKSQTKSFIKKSIEKEIYDDKSQEELNAAYHTAVMHIEYSRSSSTMELHTNSKPLNVGYEDGEGNFHSNDKDFEYSYTAYKNWKLNEEQQKKIYDLLSEANVIITRAQIIHPDMFAQFGTNLNNKRTLEQLKRQVTAAEKIVGRTIGIFSEKETQLLISNREDYYKERIDYLFSTITETRKKDLIESYEDLVDDAGIIERFKSAINALTPSDLLSILQKYGKESLAYSLDSVIRDFGYEQVIKEAEFLTAKANELMKKRIKESKNKK